MWPPWQDSPPHTVYVERGEKNHLWDIDGNEYLDFHLGYGAMVMGHANPTIVEAIKRAAAAARTSRSPRGS